METRHSRRGRVGRNATESARAARSCRRKSIVATAPVAWRAAKRAPSSREAGTAANLAAPTRGQPGPSTDCTIPAWLAPSASAQPLDDASGSPGKERRYQWSLTSEAGVLNRRSQRQARGAGAPSRRPPAVRAHRCPSSAGQAFAASMAARTRRQRSTSSAVGTLSNAARTRKQCAP